jgi:hypothetical protein
MDVNVNRMFVRNSRTFVISWPDGHDLHGLEITCKVPSAGDLLSIGTADISSESVDMGRLRDVVDTMIGTVISWNLADSTGPANISQNEFMSFDLDLIVNVIMAWSEAIGRMIQVSAPLANQSGDGKKAPYLPMESLSQNQ